MESSNGTSPRWLLLTNHGNVLLCIARQPDIRTREIADAVGIRERAAQRIVADLAAEGYIKITKDGPRNVYEVNRRSHLRHPLFAGLEIGPMLDVLASKR